MTPRFIDELQMLAIITCGQNEVLHFLVRYSQWRVLARFILDKMIIIICKKGQGRGTFYILLGLVLSGIYEKKVRNQRLQNLLLLTVYHLTRITLGYIDMRTVCNNVIRSLVFSSVGSPKYEPTFALTPPCNFLIINSISYRHPCL